MALQKDVNLTMCWRSSKRQCLPTVTVRHSPKIRSYILYSLTHNLYMTRDGAAPSSSGGQRVTQRPRPTLLICDLKRTKRVAHWHVRGKLGSHKNTAFNCRHKWYFWPINKRNRGPTALRWSCSKLNIPRKCLVEKSSIGFLRLQ